MSSLTIVLVAALAAEPAPSVGVEGRLEVVLPVADLAARPASAKAPLVLRVAGRAAAAEGTRYDLRWLGSVPGDYDLAVHLIDPRGAPVAGLPAIPVRVRSLLADDHDGGLATNAVPMPRLGGYRAALAVAAAAWVACGVALLVRRRRQVTPVAVAPAPTAAEQLADLIGRAADGRLDTDGRARLERLLVAAWRTRLGLDGLSADAARARLRADPAAGALLARIDAWLHVPPGRRTADLPALLADHRSGTA